MEIKEDGQQLVIELLVRRLNLKLERLLLAIAVPGQALFAYTMIAQHPFRIAFTQIKYILHGNRNIRASSVAPPTMTIIEGSLTASW